MKRRWKIITAIILSTAMTAMSLSPGFASEAVSEETAELTSEGIDAQDVEGQKEESVSESVNTTGQTGMGESAYEDTENDLPEYDNDSEKSDKDDETSDNSIQTADEASGENSTFAVSGNITAVINDTGVSPKVSVKYSYTQEYNGRVFNPGKFRLSKGSRILDAPSFTIGRVVGGAADSDVDYELPGITTVSQSYVYYVYPSGATRDDDYTEIIDVSVTARPVTFRSKTYYKEYDGKPLSQNLAANEDLPNVVKGKMVDGQQFSFIFSGVNKGDNPDIDTSVKNTFSVSSTSTADKNNYDVTCDPGDLIITASRNGVVNDLETPTKTKAVINNNGSVKISWKKVNSYKDNGKKGGKTTYKVYKYRENGTWGDPIVTDLKKTSYVDADASSGERLIYKIIPCGIDASGISGEGRVPAYVRVTPKIVSVAPYEGTKYANVRFIGMGSDADSYTLEHWNNKSKNTRDSINVNKYNSTVEDYKYTKRTVSVNNYLDAGGTNVTISGNGSATFSFRIKAGETDIYDYGKTVHIDETAWSKTEKLKMVTMVPVLKGKRKSNTSFELNWNKIGKANGYLVEYSRDKNFSASEANDTQRIYLSKKNKASAYNSRKLVVEDKPFGIPYYCRVTAYKKANGDATEYGTALGTSEVIVQYGRQKKVTDFKAQYFEDGNYKCDAKLTWSDDEDNIWGYYVQRWSFAYSESSKAYDKLTGYTVLQDYTSENSIKKYVSTVGGRIVNGELIKYRVQSVKKYGGIGYGENYDGFVFSEPSDYYFMNPTEVSFTKSKYKVKVDETLKPSIKFKPKKLPKKADGLSQSEFKKIFCFNDTVEYVLQSDDLTASQIKKYVTVDKSSGKLKGISTYKKDYIKLKVSSPNDKEVYDTATIYVEKSEDSSSDKKSGDLSDLKICIDAGHGGSDAGTTGNGLVEKEVNLTIAKKVGKYLENKGAKVIYTRTDDNFLELTKRTDIAKEKNCNLFISMHCNSGDASASGTEVYFSVKDKYARPKLAKHISSAVANAFGINNRGAKTKTGSNGDYYSVIRTSAEKGIPGLIVEHAFISNSSDASKLKDDDAISKAAKAEADAIEDYWDQ